MLDELRRRVTLTAAALPSVCLYTFHHTAAALNCATVSSDAALVAGGFADSSVRVWDFDQRPAQPSGAFPPPRAMHGPPTPSRERRMSGLHRKPWSYGRTNRESSQNASARLERLGGWTPTPAAVRQQTECVAEDPTRRVVRCSDSLTHTHTRAAPYDYVQRPRRRRRRRTSGRRRPRRAAGARAARRQLGAR